MRGTRPWRAAERRVVHARASRLQLMRDPLGSDGHPTPWRQHVPALALGHLEVARSHQFVNRHRTITLWVDDERVGDLRDGETCRFAVAPGPHEVCATIDWVVTPTLTVTVEPGALVRLRLWSPLTGWRLLLALAAVYGPPGAYLALAVTSTDGPDRGAAA